nr:hypothetical protein [Euryarchaeota archaeon]
MQQRFGENKQWMIPLLLVFALYLICGVASEKGLDAHVRDGYVTEGGDYHLDWGDTRPVDPLASNPEDAKDVNGPTKSYTNFAIVGFGLATLVAYTILRDKLTLAILMLNPALIYSFGKGYDELFIIAVMGIAWVLWSRKQTSEQSQSEQAAQIQKVKRAAQILLAAGVMSLIPLQKFMFGFEEWIFSILIFWAIGLSVEYTPDRFYKPRQTLGVGFALGTGVIIVLGLLGYGSFSIITSHPVRFLSAWPIALLDVILIYGLVGMVLWPFAITTWKKMGVIEDRDIGELTLLIGTLSGVIVTYVASLWTFESVLWDSEWPLHMWTMGNNGRYITILVIPAYLLVQKVNDGIDWKEKKAIIGIALIIPLSLLASLHGQTYWTDDAGEILDKEMDDNGEFLFVHDSTLGMHSLYTFH